MLWKKVLTGENRRGFDRDILTAQPQIDAVFFNNDDIASAGIYRCQCRDQHIPQQIDIAGFNDVDASAWINPLLSSLKTPLYEIGSTAAQLLI